MKIRIAVAVTVSEKWAATKHEDVAIHHLRWKHPYHVVWVEADVPLPGPGPTVQGEVVE